MQQEGLARAGAARSVGGHHAEPEVRPELQLRVSEARDPIGSRPAGAWDKAALNAIS